MVIIVMGVSGSGKTTVGTLLAESLGWAFFDADDFHPPANIEKMSKGIPLEDEDRWPWLDAIRGKIEQLHGADRSAVITCSALKEAYRARLKQDDDAVQIVYLKGDYDTIWERMQARQGHYMKAEMLKSQFEALEEPTGVVSVDIALPPDEIVTILRRNYS